MTLPRRFRSFSVALVCLSWFAACSAGPGDRDDGDSDAAGDDNDADGGDLGDADLSLGGATCEVDCGPAVCGDGLLGPGEACDDGNTTADDGCSADCSAVSSGFICPVVGEPCRPFVRCGDGVVTFPEQCDDGLTVDGDGCNARCKIELNTKCSGSPSVCTPTVCGDGSGTGLGTPEGTEGCDRGDRVPFDGCSDICQVEPSCVGTDGCTSACGDGIVLGEDCDDGNTTDGDGCSSTCTIEAGSVCESAPCETIDGKCVLRIPAIYRDFNASHADFQLNCDGLKKGMVEDALGADGTPTRKAVLPGGACAAQFSDWYHAVDGVNKMLQGEILLFDNGAGGYVNRWKDDGTQILSLTGAAKDGQPFFFPIDGDGALTTTSIDDTDNANGRHHATVNVEYSDVTNPQWSNEYEWTKPTTLYHNFHFTSQVQYWFRYDASQTASLAFTGDDDVWVFVNGTLGLDLGGLHAPLSETLTISSATAGKYGLVDGKVYPISIFHAERRTDGSSFRLTLSGLNMNRSECHSECGDGIIGPDEECDNTVNPGGYNQCTPECRLGPYCGDGIQQPEEECDFRAADAAPECNSGCRIVIVR